MSLHHSPPLFKITLLSNVIECACVWLVMSVSTACWVMSSSICSMSSGRGSWSRKWRDSSAEEIQSSSLWTSSRSASAVAMTARILSPCCWAHDWTWHSKRRDSLFFFLYPFYLSCLFLSFFAFTFNHLLFVIYIYLNFPWMIFELHSCMKCDKWTCLALLYMLSLVFTFTVLYAIFMFNNWIYCDLKHNVCLCFIHGSFCVSCHCDSLAQWMLW